MGSDRPDKKRLASNVEISSQRGPVHKNRRRTVRNQSEITAKWAGIDDDEHPTEIVLYDPDNPLKQQIVSDNFVAVGPRGDAE